ncbi:class I SAM-dependent rRNA methyltransferase [bacterium]|nr:class I SAM-dependent rRNA methyltransferase [bacterium]
MTHPICELKRGREKSLLSRHPWVFSGAVDKEPNAAPGAVVDVVSAEGEFLARGCYNPNSQIRVRALTFRDEPIDGAFFVRRLRDANDWRRGLLPVETNCYRVCYAEGDGLPGVVVDLYDRHAVVQFETAGADAFRDRIVAALQEVLDPVGILERSDGGFRFDEGLEPVTGLLSGSEPPDALEIQERGLRFLADLQRGDKTGFYLDHRESRRLAERIAHQRTVLNTFANTGGFSIACLAGGAKHVANVDDNADALALSKRAHALNDYAPDLTDHIQADAFEFVARCNDKFDLVILDPPAFSKRQAGVPRALREYKDLLIRGMRLLNPGGEILAFSNSGHVDAGMFQKVAFGAALESGLEVQIVGRLGQPFDHPINIYHPESEYLCGLHLRTASAHGGREARP